MLRIRVGCFRIALLTWRGSPVRTIWYWKSFKFIAVRHLTNTWKEEYQTPSFRFSSQAQAGRVILATKKPVACGTNLHVPKANPPPRVGLVKHAAGKHRKEWYERGPEARKRRSYSCSLCHQEGRPSKQLSFETNV